MAATNGFLAYGRRNVLDLLASEMRFGGLWPMEPAYGALRLEDVMAA